MLLVHFTWTVVFKFLTVDNLNFSDIETTWTMVRIGGGNTTQTNYQANNLEDDTLYDFIVLTISPGGASSEASEVVSVKTLPLSKSLETGVLFFNLKKTEIKIAPWNKDDCGVPIYRLSCS